MINNTVFRKTLEDARKNRGIKLVTKKRKRNYLVSEPYYHTTKFSTESLLAKEMKKNAHIYQQTSLLRFISTKFELKSHV